MGRGGHGKGGKRKHQWDSSGGGGWENGGSGWERKGAGRWRGGGGGQRWRQGEGFEEGGPPEVDGDAWAGGGAGGAGGSGPARPGDASPGSLGEFQRRWRALVDQEWAEEQRVVTERLERWPLGRLEAEGLCLTGLQGKRHGNFFDKAVCRMFLREPGRRHSFQPGDEVILSRQHPLHDKKAPKGEVLRLTLQLVEVAMQEPPYDLREGVWRMDKGANKTAYDRTCAGLRAWAGPKATAPAPLRRLLVEPPSLAEEREVLNRLEGAPDQAALLEAIAEEAKGLNASQRQAVAGAFGKQLAVIQGPPGTGKTTTACALLQAAANRMPEDAGMPLLACADSNVAVDQLLAGLLEAGARAVRVGSPARVNEQLRDSTLQARLEGHKDHAEMQSFRQELIDLKGNIHNLTGRDRGMGHAKLSRGWRDLQQWEEQMVGEILRECQVVCATLIGCGSDLILPFRFPLVVIDECTQATEPVACIALARADGPVVLVGDQQQLPPVCISEAAKRAGLGVSLFDRVIAWGGSLRPSLLTVQYRMHPLIREFPSRTFYEGRLEDGVSAEQRQPPPGFAWPGGRPLAFLDVAGTEESDRDGKSKLNRAEAQATVAAVQGLLGARGGLRPEELGVITPYLAQVAELRRLLPRDVEVKTVDGFQGREKEVILLSCVRANASGELGFLTDLRRLNVAITRPKRGLVLLGHAATLRGDSVWAALLHFLQQKGAQVPAPSAVDGW